MYDLIVIGGGPAGMTAAVYAARKKLNTLMITENIGGQTLKSTSIENYLGYSYISGVELVSKFEEHLNQFDISKEFDTVIDLKKIKEGFEVKTKEGKTFSSKAAIIATGKVPRKMKIPGEKEFYGRGVTYCATCDAPLFSGKDVAVVGGGNAALDAALQLSRIATKVYVLSRGDWRADAIVQEKVKKTANIIPHFKTKILEVKGDQLVKGVVIQNLDTGEESFLPVEGVFVEIGSIPVSEFAANLVDLNEKGEIKVDCRCRTNVPGIFAAGDVTDVYEKQIIVAAGDGCKATLAAFDYLVRKKD